MAEKIRRLGAPWSPLTKKAPVRGSRDPALATQAGRGPRLREKADFDGRVRPQIMREGEKLRHESGKKRAFHVAKRFSNELRLVSAPRHSRHEQRYAASLRPSICRAQ